MRALFLLYRDNQSWFQLKNRLIYNIIIRIIRIALKTLRMDMLYNIKQARPIRNH